MAVTGLDVQTRSLVLDGRPWGEAGPYERLAGTLRFAVDPAHPGHRLITDLERAPRDTAGRVAFSADFYLLQPAEAGRGNGTLLLDVANRGRKVALGMFNSAVRVPDPTTPEDFGNGFLLRHGYTVAWVGWQVDVPRVDGLMALDAPRVAGLVGPVRCEFRPNLAAETLPLADRYHRPQPTVDLEDPAARLTVREHAGAPAREIDRGAWRFTDPTHVALRGGFRPGHLYELVYRSADPHVVGLGLLAVRDTAAWLRRGPTAGGNPCAGRIDRAYAFGVSQSGRFLRHLLSLGLVDDEDGRRVFDAVMPHVAGARRGEFNMRFGQASLNAQHAVGGLFPFTDGEQTDPLTGERDGLLRRLGDHPPRIMATNSSAEYWRGDASLLHTDVEGRHDVDPPASSRIYLFAGTQHTPGALPPPAADPNTGGRGRHLFNVVDYAPLLRAALVNLDRWVREGVEPPPSVFPRLGDGSAVAAEATAATFRALPGAKVPDRLAHPARLDFGPEWPRGVATELPPKVGAAYPTFVSAVDADGNEVAGIRPVEVGVPLGTFTGWNPRHPSQGAEGDLMSMMGSTLPFARTRAEREASGDPRPSRAERYPSREAFLREVRTAADRLVQARHALAEDIEAMVERAGLAWDLFHQGLSAAP